MLTPAGASQRFYFPTNEVYMQVNVAERVQVMDVQGVPVVVATSTITLNGKVDCYLAEVEWPKEHDDKADDYLYRLTPMLVELEVKGYIPTYQRRMGGISFEASRSVATLARAA